jgi:hypothetical protein
VTKRPTNQPVIDEDDLDEPAEPDFVPRYGNWKHVGQFADGIVTKITLDGGEGYDDPETGKPKPCPEITIKLLAPAIVYDKGDKPVEIPAGNELTYTARTWYLADGLRKKNPQVGERVKLDYVEDRGQSKIVTVRKGKTERHWTAPPSRTDDDPAPF